MSSTAPRPSARRSHSASSIRNAAFPRVAPFAAFIGLLAFQSVIPLGASAQGWMTALRGLVVAAVLWHYWGEYEELRVKGERSKVKGQSALAFHLSPLTDFFVAVSTGLLVFAVWISFDHGWATTTATSGGFVPMQSGGTIDIPLVALRFFGLALVVPVMEELFWRSFFMRWIDARDFLARDPRRASFAAFALSSALFATEHSLWFAGLVAGAAYAGLYRLSRNLWVPIVSHAVTNVTLGAWILATGSWHLW